MNINYDFISGMMVGLALVCIGVMVGVLITTWPIADDGDDGGEEDPFDDEPLLSVDDPRMEIKA